MANGSVELRLRPCGTAACPAWHDAPSATLELTPALPIMTPGRLPTRTTPYRGETMNRKRSLRTVLPLLAAAAVAAPALAQTQPATAAAKPAPAAGALRMAIDPLTGALRPLEASDLKALEAQEASQVRSQGVRDTSARTLRGPGGAVGMMLDESHDAAAGARVGPGGQLITECASTATAASATTPLAVTGHAR